MWYEIFRGDNRLHSQCSSCIVITNWFDTWHMSLPPKLTSRYSPLDWVLFNRPFLKPTKFGKLMYRAWVNCTLWAGGKSYHNLKNTAGIHFLFDFKTRSVLLPTRIPDSLRVLAMVDNCRWPVSETLPFWWLCACCFSPVKRMCSHRSPAAVVWASGAFGGVRA